MWGTSRRVAGATMPSFTTQARRSGQGGATGGAKSLVGSLLPTCSTGHCAGHGFWDSPLEIDQASATFGSSGGKAFWQQNSDDDDGDVAVVYSLSTTPINLGSLPFMRIKFSLNQVTDLRMWHGFFSTSNGSTVVGTDDPDGDYAGVRFTSGDGYFKFCHSNNDTAFTQTAAATPVADTIYFIEIELEASVTRFRIEDANGGLLDEQFVSTQRPRDDVPMYMVHGLSTTTTAAKSWRLYYQETYMEY
jgi:hypothetical protein